MTCKNCIHDRVCPHLKDTEAEKCGAYTDKANYVEVVRCKDCRYASKCTDGYYMCKVDHRLAHDETDFCSYGERRTDDDL